MRVEAPASAYKFAESSTGNLALPVPYHRRLGAFERGEFVRGVPTTFMEGQ